MVFRLAPEITRVDNGHLPILRQNVEFHSKAADRVEEKLTFLPGQFIDLEANA